MKYALNGERLSFIIGTILMDNDPWIRLIGSSDEDESLRF